MGDGNTMNTAIYKQVHHRFILGGIGDLYLPLSPMKRLHPIPCPLGRELRRSLPTQLPDVIRSTGSRRPSYTASQDYIAWQGAGPSVDEYANREGSQNSAAFLLSPHRTRKCPRRRTFKRVLKASTLVEEYVKR
jgi:hypothetical protein